MTNPTPQAPTNPPAPQPTPQAAAPSADAVKLHNYLQIIDPQQQGVGLDMVRPIYPKIGWNVILAHCAELESANKLSKVFVPGLNGKGGYESYTWQ